MPDRDAPRLDQLSDAHLADKAAYGDLAAATTLLDRIGDQAWRVAALACADTATATRAAARAFTRTLAGVAAGVDDPTVPVDRAVVAAAHELAVTTRVDDGPDIDLPTALAGADPSARVAAWLEAHEGWSAEAAARATLGGSLAAEAPVVDDALRAACATVEPTVPPEATEAAVATWQEWQGIGLTIPEHHPLTTVLGRLDAPLGHLGTTLGRAGTGLAAAARRTGRRPHGRTGRGRDHRRDQPQPAAAAPAADHLPIGADDDRDHSAVPAAVPAGPTPLSAPATLRGGDGDADADADADERTTSAGHRAAAEEPAVPHRDAERAGRRAATDGDAGLGPVAVPGRADEGDDLVVPVVSTGTDTPRPASTGLTPPDDAGDLVLPERRRGARDLVVAGATPTRARVGAALAAGILTAAALGSLLTAAPAVPGDGRADRVAAGEAPQAGGAGDLLDDRVVIEPASATRAADPDDGPTSSSAPGGSSAPRRADPGGDGTDARGGTGPTAPGSTGTGSGGGGAADPSGHDGGGGAVTPGTTPGSPPAPAPTPTTTAPGPSPAPTTAPAAPTTTTAPAPPTTQPPAPPTTPPAPPTTRPAGPVCTLLPVLCPGGGLIPG